MNENELFDQHFPLLSFQNEKGELVDIVRTSLRMKKKKRTRLQESKYQIGISGGADPQFVAFLLHFLDEIDEHVCLGQVL